MGISSIKYYERTVELDVPAEFKLLSAVGDLTNGLPSLRKMLTLMYSLRIQYHLLYLGIQVESFGLRPSARTPLL
jgi:hypothetical protein